MQRDGVVVENPLLPLRLQLKSTYASETARRRDLEFRVR
jgi:hypothetical protein